MIGAVSTRIEFELTVATAYDEVRRLALALPNVSEGNSYGGPSLHVGRKFLGRLREDGETLVLKIDPAGRERLLESCPDAFFVTEHYRNHPYVLVNLLAVAPAALRPLIEQAWRLVAPRRAIAEHDARAGIAAKPIREEARAPQFPEKR